MKEEIIELSKQVEQEIRPMLEKIDNICQKNSQKVLEAFQGCRLQEAHLNSSTRYY